jgi:hypothetical protein
LFCAADRKLETTKETKVHKGNLEGIFIGTFQHFGGKGCGKGGKYLCK